MDLYKVKNNKIEQVDRESFKLEKDIQSLVEKNLDTLFELEFVCTEFTIGEFRLDTLCFDNETNSFVIVEYKKGSSYSVIDQGYSYLSVMLNNKSDFILEYIEQTGKSIKKDDIDWSQSRIIFLSQSFNSYQKNSVNFKDVPFELWEIKKFSNNTITLNQHISSSSESIQKIDSGNTIIKSVSKEVQVFSEEDILRNKKVIQKVRDTYYEFKDKISNWDDIRFVTKKNYISIWKNKRVVVYMNVRKEFIRVHILRRIDYKGNVDSIKKRFTLDDSKKMFKNWKNDYKELHEYDLKDNKDLDYFVLMIKQKYDSL